MLSSLPGDGDLLALTVDDGVSSDVVRLYTEFARDTGVRLTYFVNGAYPSWTENQELLRPLVDSGQIQLGQPHLVASRPDEVAVNRCGRRTSAHPRLPLEDLRRRRAAISGRRTERITHTSTRSRASSDTTNTAVVGLVEDHVVIPAERDREDGQVLHVGAIVIGHLNHEPVTHVYMSSTSYVSADCALSL